MKIQKLEFLGATEFPKVLVRPPSNEATGPANKRQVKQLLLIGVDKNILETGYNFTRKRSQFKSCQIWKLLRLALLKVDVKKWKEKKVVNDWCLIFDWGWGLARNFFTSSPFSQISHIFTTLMLWNKSLRNCFGKFSSILGLTYHVYEKGKNLLQL